MLSVTGIVMLLDVCLCVEKWWEVFSGWLWWWQWCGQHAFNGFGCWRWVWMWLSCLPDVPAAYFRYQLCAGTNSCCAACHAVM